MGSRSLQPEGQSVACRLHELHLKPIENSFSPPHLLGTKSAYKYLSFLIVLILFSVSGKFCALCSNLVDILLLNYLA